MGHRMNKCASRYALDALAKELGVSWEWGAAKSCAYYLDYTQIANNQAEIERDKKNADDSRYRKLMRKVTKSHGFKGHKCRKAPLF